MVYRIKVCQDIDFIDCRSLDTGLQDHHQTNIVKKMIPKVKFDR